MRFFELLSRAVKAWFRYRKSMDKLRTMAGEREMLDTVLVAYRAGDYRTALEASKGVEGDSYFRGTMLMQLGRFDEAGQWLQQTVSTQKEPRMAALANTTLGQLYLEQERYEDALRCFSTALRLWPERGSTHRDVAEAWLRRGDRPSEALRWARLAVEKERADDGLSPDSKNINLSQDLATLAWAVAAESRDAAEVDRLAVEALAISGANPVTSMAQMHYYFGRAYTALGNAAVSVRLYEEAARVDPNGLWGRAALAMATGSTPTAR